MEDFDKLFTIADVAEMTSMSDRTIRNYLRSGLLTGRKVGGQWRFTAQDIAKFFDRSDVKASISEQWRLDVADFLDGVSSAVEGERQACTVVDLYVTPQEADAYNERVCEFFSDHAENARVNFDYSEKEHRARFILFSDPQTAAQVLNILK